MSSSPSHVPRRSARHWLRLAILLVPALGCVGYGGPPLADDEALRVTGTRRITFDEILDGRVRLRERAPRVRFDADGDAIAVGRRWTSVATGEPTEPTDAERPRPAVLDGLDDVRFADGVERSFPPRHRSISRDGSVLFCEVRGGFGVRTLDREEARFIPFSGDASIVTLAPDGGHASWVSGNDLWVVALPDGEPRAWTTGGSADLFHGVLDWVYQEEVYGRGNYRGHWWSPNGFSLAWLRLDESAVPTFSIIDHLPARQERSDLRYPKAGDPNPGVSVHVRNVHGGEPIEVDLSRYGSSDEILVVRVDWTPDGETLLLQVQDRIQTWLELLAVDLATGIAERWIREDSESWVNVLGAPRWLADGERFLWMSERTGFRHAYLFEKGSLRPITKGDWQVDRILSIDEEREELWLSASIPSAVEQHAYRIPLAGGVLTQLTSIPGTHSLTIAPDHRTAVDRWSAHDDPGGAALIDRDSRIVRVLVENEAPSLEEYALSIPERHRIPARDGVLLEAMITKPVPFDPEVAYPVLLMTYSGPDAPTVRDRWSLDPWRQFLAQQGVIILQVNNRSSSGRGQVDTAECYLQLGVSELRDLTDAVDWLTAHPWADAARVGIAGWSYGGFMAGYALTHSDHFALGLAGAGVYDWRLYDTIYTERYMRTPSENAEGYLRSSVVAAAGDLQGHLVIIHGVDDDNVHVQNAMQLAHALQRAEKSFELMLYPSATHGIRDRLQRRHHRRLEWRAIEEHLLDGLGGTSRTEPFEGSR